VCNSSELKVSNEKLQNLFLLVGSKFGTHSNFAMADFPTVMYYIVLVVVALMVSSSSDAASVKLGQRSIMLSDRPTSDTSFSAE